MKMGSRKTEQTGIEPRAIAGGASGRGLLFCRGNFFFFRYCTDNQVGTYRREWGCGSGSRLGTLGRGPIVLKETPFLSVWQVGRSLK